MVVFALSNGFSVVGSLMLFSLSAVVVNVTVVGVFKYSVRFRTVVSFVLVAVDDKEDGDSDDENNDDDDDDDDDGDEDGSDVLVVGYLSVVTYVVVVCLLESSGVIWSLVVCSLIVAFLNIVSSVTGDVVVIVNVVTSALVDLSVRFCSVFPSVVTFFSVAGSSVVVLSSLARWEVVFVEFVVLLVTG